MSPSAPPPSNLHNNLFGQSLVGLDLIEHAGDVDEVIDARVREYGNVLYHAQRRTRWRIAGWMDGWMEIGRCEYHAFDAGSALSGYGLCR